MFNDLIAKKKKLAVIGLGYVGLPIALEFAKHFSVERDILKTVFLIAKFIKEDLNVLGEKHYARFMTISQMDGLLGKGKSGNVSIVGGGLTGLVKCLNLEWSSVFCRSVDIDPSLNSARAADIVFEEYHDANRGIIEVGYKDTQRLQPIETLEEIAMEGKEQFEEAGGEQYKHIPCLNDSDAWVSLMVKWIHNWATNAALPV